jgi:putative transcriptional regulator
MLKTDIHMLRWEAGMKQEELAEKVGVRRETISALEKGKYNPSLKLAMDIAKVFGKRVEDIFHFYEEDADEE